MVLTGRLLAEAAGVLLILRFVVLRLVVVFRFVVLRFAVLRLVVVFRFVVLRFAVLRLVVVFRLAVFFLFPKPQETTLGRT